MLRQSRVRFGPAVSACMVLVLMLGVVSPSLAAASASSRHQVTVPEEDRFTPFAMTIHVGDVVRWTNNDGDDHTVVSDDAVNSTGPRGENKLLTANGGTLVLQFNQPGMFVYYCRFHAYLDTSNQPAAPGPDGGIQDANGNYGTPMSGVITVVP